MADLLIFIKKIFPEIIYGSFENYSFQKASANQLISIEDFLFNERGENLQLPQDTLSVLTIPDSGANASTIDELMIISEFALALLVNNGHPYFSIAAIFSGDKCTFARLTSQDSIDATCAFADQLTGVVISQWMKKCILAYRRQKNRIHVTAHRYVRYSRTLKDLDSLLDLCISLESLIDSQTEVSFRFSTTLAKITSLPKDEAKELSEILYKLYDLRSKIVHGDSKVNKALKKFEPHLPKLHEGAVRILTTYIYYISDKTFDEWKIYLKESVFE